MYTSMFRKAMLGDTATLNLDFTTGTLDSRLTFTRSGTGTYINSSGYVTTASTNVARFDYDPATLAPRGLLIEGQAVNLMTYSEDQGNNSTWNAYSTAVTRTSGQTDPSNATTATKIVFDATSADAVISRSVTISNATVYTISVWMRADSGTISNVRFGRAASAGGATFPTLTTTWQRVQLVFTSSGTSDGIEIRVLSSGSPKTATIHIWGAQLEAGSGASSYIPTTTSTVTRNADQVVLSNLAGISFNQSAGTIYSQVEIVEKLRGLFIPHVSFDTSGGGRCWWWMRHNHDATVGQRILGTCFNSAGSTAIATSNYTHTSGLFKFASSLNPASGSMVYVIAGGAPQTTTAAAFTLATAAQMSINKNNDVDVTQLGSMWIRAIKYYPTALSNAELQTMTAS
jgi:hypothetical protein